MGPFFVGPIPPLVFLESFIPPRSADSPPIRFDARLLDFIIEFKKGSSDPFVDDSNGEGQGQGKDNPFLCKEGPNCEVLGLLTAYATAILGAQYRTHLFMVLIAGEYARLIRWDRGGAVVTNRIPFNEEYYLFDFLTRYDMASREDRGHDPTVTVPNDDEIKAAKDVVADQEWTKEEALKITMPHQDTESHFIIPRPVVRPGIPVGRWTRSSIAFDVDKKRRVFLKDSWRILLDDIRPEGEIYHWLHENNVPNIPSCLLAGDVGDNARHRSRTHEVSLDPYHPCWKITPHRHYRMVLGVVGRRLEKFTHTREMVKAMQAALKAMKPNPKSKIDGGMLIDWDLSKFVNPNDKPSTSSATRQHSRTGTWKFMAADLVEEFGTKQTFAHDLESFFSVLLWIVLTQVETSWGDGFRSSFLEDTFSTKVYKGSGGSNKTMVLTSRIALHETGKFKIPDNPTLAKFLYQLKTTVFARYDIKPSGDDIAFEPDEVPENELDLELGRYNRWKGNMESHSKMLDQFVAAWASQYGIKRSRSVYEEGLSSSSKRHQA
ncbi:hypothetical protein F5888DRAFT_1903888 [Russula emetica]|nr:hypothetical protein F5888DRAFT_1903888 [Russula emetica]